MVCPHGFVFEGRGSQRTAAQGTNDGNRRSLALMFLAGDGEPITDEARAVAIWWANDIARVPLRWAHRTGTRPRPGDPLALLEGHRVPPARPPLPPRRRRLRRPPFPTS